MKIKKPKPTKLKHLNRIKIVEAKPILLKPAPHLCQECAVKHTPEEPHDANSIYYQVSFRLKHGRNPTWKDAMEHCSQEVKEAWIIELRKFGIEVEK